MEEKIKALLKKYGASDEEIKNFMEDLGSLVEEKIEETFDETNDDDFKLGDENV